MNYFAAGPQSFLARNEGREEELYALPAVWPVGSVHVTFFCLAERGVRRGRCVFSPVAYVGSTSIADAWVVLGGRVRSALLNISVAPAGAWELFQASRNLRFL